MKKLITIFSIFSLLIFPIKTFGKDGECIEGDCENGKGTFIYSDGSKYIGEWKDGMKQGNGKFFFSNGGNFEGCWWEDYYKRGLLTLPNGIRTYVD